MCTPGKKEKDIIVIIVVIIVVHVLIMVIMVIVVMVIVIIIVIIVNIITIVIVVILTMGGCGLVGTSVVLGPAVDQRFETTPIKIRDGCRRKTTLGRGLLACLLWRRCQ